ncbi:TetR family transcriptional regulator [Agromyces luteolus]|uniref:TetR family transcriptional regulator n=2 Tax=Agromyces luteolus TaxID=88373 RepID=A0A7C9LSA7_9MICO|nr:TetR family transcriptional regulator [Agromyces luteolus]
MLNMRSVRPEDATTAARIRDAAIARFGAHGYAGTSLREVASDVGVSAALVIHHFGSKEGLRRACDDWLVHELMGEKDRLGDATVAATIREWLDDPARFRTSIAYLAVMLADGSPAADRLFDLLLAETGAMLERGVADGSMHPSSDPDLRAVLITAYGLAPLLLRGQFARVLGAPLDSPAVVRRMTLPTLEFYTQGLYADTRLLDAARDALDAAADGHAPESRRVDPAPRVRSDKGPGNPVQDPDPPVGDSARA